MTKTKTVKAIKPLYTLKKELERKLMDMFDNVFETMYYSTDSEVVVNKFKVKPVEGYGLRAFLPTGTNGTPFMDIELIENKENDIVDEYAFIIKTKVYYPNQGYSDKDYNRAYGMRPYETFNRLCELNKIKLSKNMGATFSCAITNTYVPCINEGVYDHVIGTYFMLIDELISTLNARAVMDRDARLRIVQEQQTKFLQRALEETPKELDKQYTIPVVINMLQEVGELGSDKLQEIVDIIQE